MLMFGTTKSYRGQTGWFTLLGFSISGLSETNVRTMRGKTKLKKSPSHQESLKQKMDSEAKFPIAMTHSNLQ